MNPTQSKLNPVKIPLQDILLANGYEIDREKSSSRNPVLKSNAGHKVIISLMSNGDYLYFNPNDNNDKGNIYSLCKNHGLDINEMLETYLQMPLEKKFAIKSQDSRDNIKAIMDKYNELPNYDNNADIYFKKRSIDSNIVNTYAKNIKVDSYNNVYFPQYTLVKDRNNIFVRGWTMKFATPLYKDKNGKLYDKPIKSITKGEKGLEILMPKDTKNIKSVILAESSIDSLSFLEISKIADEKLRDAFQYKLDNAIIIATGGTSNIEKTMETIEFIHNKLNIKEYHLAFDNDSAGIKMKNEYSKALSAKYDEFGKESIVKIHTPYAKDFNDDLKIVKILNIKDSCPLWANKDRFKETIYKATDELIDNYYKSKQGSNSGYILKKIQKLDKLLPQGIDSKLKKFFNEKMPKYKDKRIKPLEMGI